MMRAVDIGDKIPAVKSPRDPGLFSSYASSPVESGAQVLGIKKWGVKQ